MKKDKLTRRDFLKVASATTAGLAVSACGLISARLTQPIDVPPSTPTHIPPSPLPTTVDETATPVPATISVEDKTFDISQCHQIRKGELQGESTINDHIYDCIIVGGGMSGLVAAWKLRQLGLEDILVLEKNEQIGGLCTSDTIGGIKASRASAYPSYPFNSDMIGLYKELGFIKANDNTSVPEVNEKYILKPPFDQIFINGKWIANAYEENGFQNLPISQAARDDFSKLVNKLNYLYEWEDGEGRYAFDCPIDLASSDPSMRGLDKMTLKEYILSQGWDIEMIKIFEPLLKSAYGVGYDRISAWAALDLLTDELLPADPGEDSIGFPGGNAFFTEQLASQLSGDQIKIRTIVSQISEQDQEMQVRVISQGAAQTLRARSVIFAISQFMAPYLLPDLPADRRKGAQSFEYASYVVANLAVTQTPPNLAYSNQLIGDFLMSDFIVADWAAQPDPLSAPLNRPNVLTAYCPLTAADRMQIPSAAPTEWQKRITAELEQCVPGISKTITSFSLYRWGHAFALPVKGTLFSEERRLARKPFGRVFFAGADVEGIPTIDQAMAAGFRTAREVSNYLG